MQYLLTLATEDYFMPDIVIAFFALGLIAGLVKSDLEVPQSIYETLSILLMLTLGLKGGLALHGHAENLQLLDLVLIAAMGFFIPLLLYPVLRKLVGLPSADAISIAAHYGSVSAGTFAVVFAMAEVSGLPLKPETTLYLVLLELPAIIVMLGLYRYLHRNNNAARSGKYSFIPELLKETLTSRGVILLMGGLAIGWLYGPEGIGPLSGPLFGGFKTLLALFLLEMGLCTAKVCLPFPREQWKLLMFAAVAPFALAWAGIGLGFWLGLPTGSILVLAGITASASYIAAPAAIRASIPEANIGLAMLAALGVTFPVNVLLGLPLYREWITLLAGT
jgi:hypothetical protein